MKHILKTFILFMILGLVSCEKSLPEVNIDPNTSPTANDAQLLTGATGYLGYIVDVDLNSQSFLWAQYYTWGIGVSIGNQERFVMQPDDSNNYWDRAYAKSLTDLKVLGKSDKASYRGISKVLTAYVYQGLVDHYGDIPFSQALQGEIADGSILAPSYDGAASVYANLVTMLDAAIVDLSAASSVGAEDLIFGGDISKWQKFANSLQLRMLMRTSEAPGIDNSAAITSLVAAGNFIESNGDNATIEFDGAAGNQNPMYARFEWGVGDFYFASNATLNVLNAQTDPRVDAFFVKATSGNFADQFRGIDQGTIDDEPFTADASEYSGSSPVAYGESNSVMLMSATEVWFLRAEAAARYSTADGEAASFTEAIVTNFDNLGIADGATFANGLGYDVAADLDTKLNWIGVQKWISLNGTQEDEGWIESRRFDRPNNRIFTQGIFQTPPLSSLAAGQFPATWLYPATEQSLNVNAPAQRVITDRIFWDN